MSWNDKIDILSKTNGDTIESATLITLIIDTYYLRGDVFFIVQS